jgi:Uroporphyrinogen decarboxylase (URO-D)
MMMPLDIDHNEMERRKELYRRFFDYQEVDHLPVFIWLQGATRPEHTIRWELESGQNQLEANSAWIARSLRLLPDDYIPVVRITQGYLTIASMFGCQIHWSEDPNQPPGVLEHPIKDLQQVYDLKRPGIGDGMMPENLRRMRLFAENLPADVSLTGVDIGGPLNNLKDLVDTNLLYTGFYDDPQAVHSLLGLLTDVQLEMMQALVTAAGGDLKRFGSLDFDPVWHPQKYISFSSDDVSATIGPKTFEKFCAPYHDRLYAPWGSGGLHNCGPHPCREMYVRLQNPVKYLNCSHHYTHNEYSALKQVFAGWGVIEPMFDQNESAEEMLAGYREMMENLAPDTLAIPICVLDKTWSDNDITDLYDAMRKISEEYARAMHWTK